MSKDLKECYRLHGSASAPYSIHGKIAKETVASPKVRKKTITKRLTQEELGLVSPSSNEASQNDNNKFGIHCHLSSDEIFFIEQYSEICGLSYEQAVDKVFHDGLKLLQESFNLYLKCKPTTKTPQKG